MVSLIDLFLHSYLRHGSQLSRICTVRVFGSGLKSYDRGPSGDEKGDKEMDIFKSVGSGSGFFPTSGKQIKPWIRIRALSHRNRNPVNSELQGVP